MPRHRFTGQLDADGISRVITASSNVDQIATPGIPNSIGLIILVKTRFPNSLFRFGLISIDGFVRFVV